MPEPLSTVTKEESYKIEDEEKENGDFTHNVPKEVLDERKRCNER